MNHCTECNFPLEDGMLTCPACGSEVVLVDEFDPERRTIEQQHSNISETVEFDNEQYGESLPSDDLAIDLDSEEIRDQDGTETEIESIVFNTSVGDGGTGTVSAPGVEDLLDIDEADNDLGATIDGGLTELDEADDFDFDDDRPGVIGDTLEFAPFGMGDPQNEDMTGTADAVDVDADQDSGNADPSNKTVQAATDATFAESFDADSSENVQDIHKQTTIAFGNSVGTDDALDPYATHVDTDSLAAENSPENSTIDIAGEDMPTHPSADHRTTMDATGESTDENTTRIVASSDVGSVDSTGTVVLPGADEQNPGDQTVIYDSAEPRSSTLIASGGSSAQNTDDKLVKLWKGAAGSSENPMHSLQAQGLQASDSVFQRVAMRRLTDASSTTDEMADYKIVSKLGEGAMGVVYTATQTAVNRTVAIKMAKPNFQKNEESRRRFLYEAHITADLDHSNIVPIHELGANESGELFYSMKLVRGTEWSRVLRKKTRDQNLEIFLKVTDAMAFAHDKGVIHRDLKPENTMLGSFGEVFVTDWGTAINLDKDTTYLAEVGKKGERLLTVDDASSFVKGDQLILHDGVEIRERVEIVGFDGVNPNQLILRRKLAHSHQPTRNLKVAKAFGLAGTPCYMAPEMAGHKLPKLGRTSDIYVLGAILYDIVTGKPPHTGTSVTQCLRAALNNNIFVDNNDDPLLTIAYKAMATEPADRYQNVEQLQEAVREYRRHTESIMLTERSDGQLAGAIAKADYNAFQASLFGYRQAMELWPENKSAKAGLKKARLALGQAGFKKGDYDLVLQTLDKDVPEEAALREQAVAAKKKVASREASLKLLQKVIAAVVLFALVGLSGLSLYAWGQKTIAQNKTLEAESATKKAVASAAAEKSAKEDAFKEREAADKAREEAVKKKEEADIARDESKRAEEKQRLAKIEEEKQRQNAEAATQVAKMERAAADKARDAAENAKAEAVRRAAQIQLGEYNSSLALAKSQIESFDIAAAESNLGKLRTLFSSQAPDNQQPDGPPVVDVFAGNSPQIDTWGWQRIELLSSLDLPKTKLDGQTISATNFSIESQRAVVGTGDGTIQVLQYSQANGLSVLQKRQQANASINSAAISPDGNEVVYSFTTTAEPRESGVVRWDLKSDSVQPVASTQKRSFQHFAFTADGDKVLAGINGGIWSWDRTADWFAKSEPSRRVDGIRGELKQLQQLGPGRILVTTLFQNDVLLFNLDPAAGKMQPISIPGLSDDLLVSASHTFVDNQVLLGLADNRLVAGKLDPQTNRIENLVDLEDKHRTPVTTIAVNEQGRAVTSSIYEPVAHVWNYDLRASQWKYETFLTGTPKNIAGTGLLGDRRVLAVDVDGQAILWDVERQKQRRRLERRGPSGEEPAEYFAPVQLVAAGPSDGTAITIDENGVVDLWNLVDGSTRRVDGQRWSYFGHTPGATLVDSAIDLERGLVVTAASLRNATADYLAEPDHDWEFCLWDAATGAMKRRWTAANRVFEGERTETIEQRISLVDSGRKILFASDKETRLVDLEGEQNELRKTDFGSYFAVPNPRNESLLALVKRSGAVRMFDLEDSTSWDERVLNASLADPSDIPVKGVWSEDGRRFYLSFSTGGLAAFDWNGQNLVLRWSTRRGDETAEDRPLLKSLSTTTGRVNSHMDVDISVRTNGNYDILHIATRTRGLQPTTRLVSLQFVGQGQPTVLQEAVEPGIRWLQSGEVASLSDRVHDVFVVDSSRIRTRVRLNGTTFVSTDSAQVYGLVDGKAEVISYGRARLLSSTASRDGKSLYTLMDDGAVWLFSANDDSWRRMPYTFLDANQISLSPDTTKLLVLSEGKSQLIDPQSGEQLGEMLDSVQTAAWDPQADSRLAVGLANGQIDAWQDGQRTNVAEMAVAVGDTLQSLHFFNETWSNGNPARKFLVVHAQNDQADTLRFVPLDQPPAGVKDVDTDEDTVETLAKGTLVTVSPTENIIVTGSESGTVSVWFASPTHERKPRPLFDLEGHRGARITSLNFTTDGRTIISADSKNRLFAWMSDDPIK